MRKDPVIIVGAGLAGSELALQLCKSRKVILIDSKPKIIEPCYKYHLFPEVICSNSFKSLIKTKPQAMLKKELLFYKSELIKTAFVYNLKVGQGLVFNKKKFMQKIYETIKTNKNIKLIEGFYVNNFEQIKNLAKSLNLTNFITVIATGALTTKELLESMGIYDKNCYFFDAISIKIDNNIDFKKGFWANRYNKIASKDMKTYFNIPLSKEQYYKFVKFLLNANKVEFKDFEKDVKLYQNCIPIEYLAQKGINTLAFGNLRPIGFNKKPSNDFYAVIQLRPQDNINSSFELVGFQTKLTYQEQNRLLKLIPGLEKANILQYGSIHRNSYINSPKLLTENLKLKINNKYDIYIAGQLTGTEGYCEAILTAFIIYFGINKIKIPKFTIAHCISKFLTDKSLQNNFQPNNVNYGLLMKYFMMKDKNKIFNLHKKSLLNFQFT